jgi:hypothetical protein
MKTATMKDSLLLKKPQYSSRIVVSPNTTSNKNGPKLTYKRGNSTDSYREKNNGQLENPMLSNFQSADAEPLNIQSLITQAQKNSAGRPNTSGLKTANQAGVVK